MNEYAAFALINVAVFVMVGLGLRAGTRWIDKMLHYKPVDPSKPIVRRLPD